MYSEEIGGICWIDLTTGIADELRDFYCSVVGFEVEACSMGDYDDYVMKSPGDVDAAVGVCHASGSNANLPPQWLIYFNVKDLPAAMKECEDRGGKIVCPPRDMDGSSMCVIQDPSGAVCALIAKV